MSAGRTGISWLLRRPLRLPPAFGHPPRNRGGFLRKTEPSRAALFFAFLRHYTTPEPLHLGQVSFGASQFAFLPLPPHSGHLVFDTLAQWKVASCSDEQALPHLGHL